LNAYTNEDKSINSEAFPSTINKHLSQVIETNKRLHKPQNNNFQTVLWCQEINKHKSCMWKQTYNYIFESTIQQ